MKTICENLGWDVGALWEIDDGAQRIGCVDFWRAPEVDEEIATELCMGRTFARGDGIPGEVWHAAEAIWVVSLDDAERFPRSTIAARAASPSPTFRPNGAP